MDSLSAPEFQIGVTTTVLDELSSTRPGTVVGREWVIDGITSGSIREYKTPGFGGRGAGEASIASVVSSRPGEEFIVVTDDKKAGRMINRLNLDDIKTLNLQGYVESSLLTGGVHYQDYINIAATQGWPPIGATFNVLGFEYGRTQITNGVEIKATPFGLEIIDRYGNTHEIGPTELFRVTEDGRVEDLGCFPSFTLIQTGLGAWKPISEISVGDVVLAPDPSSDLGRGELVPRRVTKVYRNTTTEWIKLSWVENGEAKELFATPGHHFLDEFGQFPPLEDMVAEGRATVVLASGELAEVSAERIVYSAETAHLFEQAHSYGMIAGNAALQPVGMDAWQSYNFEVDHLHTYVAGGVRVHNQSGILGRIGNSIDSAMDRLGVVGDAVGDIIGGSLKAAGEIVNGIIGGVAAVASGFASGFSKLAQGDIIGAAGDIVRGIGEGVASVVRGIGEAVKDFVGGVRDAVKSVVDTVKGWFDPVVLDLDGDGIELTGLGQTGANYDFDNDGYLEATGWIGEGDGLLAYDVDQDGNVDQARELSLKMWDATATTDFDGLRKHFDSNKDGVFDSRDAEFSKFRIWKDADSDGKVDSGELLTLAQAGIRAIDLKSYTSDFDVEKVKYNFGNTIHGMAEFVRTNGQRGNVADVSFATANFGYKIVQRGGDTIFEFESGSESGC